MNPQDTSGGLLGLANASGSSGTTATPDVFSGGTTLDPSTLFDPSLFGGQGVFSPTQTDTGNLPPSTPQVAQAQQDPSGQIIDKPAPQTSEGGVNQGAKGDRDTSQPVSSTVDQTGKGDRATTPDAGPIGPTAPGGQQAQKPPDQAAVDPRAPLQPPQSPLARLAAAQKAVAPAAAGGGAAAAPAPQPPPTPAPAAAPTGGGRPVAGGTPTAAGPASTVGAPPMGGAAAGGIPPGIMKAIMSLLGVPTGPSSGGPQPLDQVAQQAYPQRPGMPMSPTGRLGPYGRAMARRRLFQGGDQDAGGDDQNYSGTQRVPPPGSNSEVTAPTADQVRATRMAGTDTPPTEGFSEYLQSERAHFGEELKNDKTKWETLAMIALEHGHDPAAVAESLLNRANYAKTSINNMLHSGFYGPINKGMLAREIRMLQRNPEYAAKLNAGLETAMRGSNLLGGATDQGSGRDPNVGHRGGRVTRFGETYNDWGGGPGGHDGAAAYRRAQQLRVQQEQREGARGKQFAMDIGRATRNALPLGGADIGPMPRGGTVGSRQYRMMEEERRKREEDRREAAAS